MGINLKTSPFFRKPLGLFDKSRQISRAQSELKAIQEKLAVVAKEINSIDVKASDFAYEQHLVHNLHSAVATLKERIDSL